MPVVEQAPLDALNGCWHVLAEDFPHPGEDVLEVLSETVSVSAMTVLLHVLANGVLSGDLLGVRGPAEGSFQVLLARADSRVEGA